MTRAEKWLIVAAAGDPGKTGDSWYDRIAAGLTPSRARCRIAFDGGDGLRLETRRLDRPRGRRPCCRDRRRRRHSPRFRSARAAARRDAGDRCQPLGSGRRQGAAGRCRAGRRGGQGAGHAGSTCCWTSCPHLPEADWPDRAAALHPMAGRGRPARDLLAEAARVLTIRRWPRLRAPMRWPRSASPPTLPGLAAALHGVDRPADRDADTRADRRFQVERRGARTTPTGCPDGLLRQMGAYAAHARADLSRPPDRDGDPLDPRTPRSCHCRTIL